MTEWVMVFQSDDAEFVEALATVAGWSAVITVPPFAASRATLAIVGALAVAAEQEQPTGTAAVLTERRRWVAERVAEMRADEEKAGGSEV